MLEYNKPLVIKDSEDKEIYVIKELTEDAEFELERIYHEIGEAREDLLNTGKYARIGMTEIQIGIQSAEMALKKTRQGGKLSKGDEEIAENLLKKYADFELENQRKGLKKLTIDKILFSMQREQLLEMVDWVRENIENQDKIGLADSARELYNIATHFINYKEDLKKK